MNYVAFVVISLLAVSAALGQSNPPTIQFLRNPKISDYDGVWLGAGDAIPFAVIERNGSLPDCDAFDDAGNWHLHYSEDLHATVVYSSDPNKNAHHLMSIGHRRTSLNKIVSLSGYTLTFENVQTKVQSCAHYRPYIDPATGHLEALSIFGTEYRRNSTTGQVVAKSLTCSLKGTERPGCYKVNSNTVKYFGYGKLRCHNGGCALKSPYFKQVDEAH